MRRLLILGLSALLLASVSAWFFYSRREPASIVRKTTVQAAARFTSLRGTVEYRKAGQLDWIGASLDTILLENDTIRTGKNSTADMRFADGTELTLSSESLVAILSHGLARVEPRLDFGDGFFRAPKEPGTGISGPNSRTMPGPEAQGSMSVGDAGTNIEMQKGKAHVTTDAGQEVDLLANEGVQIDPNGVAGAKTTLPPAPVVMDMPRPPSLFIRSVEVRGDQLHLRGQTEPGVALTINGERIEVEGDGSFGEHVVLKAGTTELVIRATSAAGAVTEQRLPFAAPGVE